MSGKVKIHVSAIRVHKQGLCSFLIALAKGRKREARLRRLIGKSKRSTKGETVLLKNFQNVYCRFQTY
jgi:hypothetical protein